MTRRSRRELEKDLDELGSDDDRPAVSPMTIVYEDRESGEWFDDVGGQRLDKSAVDADVVLDLDAASTHKTAVAGGKC
jgi:hypothetical protein